MEDQHYIFDPGTHTSKCPMPTRFDHLLKWVTKVENYISLHSQEDIININSQLDQTTNLMISNIIQRVIAQIIGQTATGFVTIKGTDDGALHVSIQEDILSQKTLEKAEIDFNTAISSTIITGTAGKKTNITSIVFTVGGETNIKFIDGATDITGLMDFGGANEPRGIVIPHGESVLPLGTANDFKISSSAAVQVSGYVVYYKE